MRTTVRLPDSLLARARKKALADGTTLTALIEEGLRTVVSARPKIEKPGRFSLPVSSRKGGLTPGIDAVKINTETEEMDDLEMLRRTSLLK